MTTSGVPSKKTLDASPDAGCFDVRRHIYSNVGPINEQRCVVKAR